jgi:4-amino-4-deoxy-L-arabinose transferase-like glycosyltransferase
MKAARAQEALLLGVLMILAAALRFAGLGSAPPGLFRDEAEKGYTAFELWKTGRHTVLATGEASRPMPLFIDVMGDQTSAIYQYLSAPVVGAFGLSIASTRAVAALAGTLSVLALWAVARCWWGPWPALLAAGLAAFAPQGVMFSRWAQQGVTVPLWTALGVWLAWKALWSGATERRALAAGGGLLLGLAFYSYDPARIAVPAIIAGLAIGLGRAGLRERRREALTILAAFLAIALPVFLFAVTQEGSHRFRRVSVFSEGIGSGILAAALNYLRHLDPRFLFLFGDANPRHQLPVVGGLVGAFAAVPVIVGGGVLAWQARSGALTREDRARLWLTGAWVLGAPLAASLTREGIPHALRCILLGPGVILLAAEGARAIAVAWPQRRMLVAGFAAAALAVHFAFAVVGLTRLMKPTQGAWQEGILPALQMAHEADPPGGVYLSASVPYAPYFALFSEQTDPRALREEGLATMRTMLLPPETRPPQLPPRSLLIVPRGPTVDSPALLLSVEDGRTRVIGDWSPK